jgi:hypothetical protein
MNHAAASEDVVADVHRRCSVLMFITELKMTPNAVDNPSIFDIANDGAMVAGITDDASTDHSTR